MCSTSSSSFWYKGPFAWQNRSLCSSCGLYWRKYAAESSIAESIVASHKRQAAAMAAAEEKELGVAPPPVKMLKSNKETKVPQTQPTTVTEKTATPTKCLFCRRLQPIKKLEQCTQCTMSAHQGCYGITEEDLSIEGGWQCDACANEKTLDAALVPRCVLCPKEKEPEEDEQQAKKADRLLNGELPPDASDRPHGNSLQARRIKQGKYGTDAKTTIDQQYSRSIPGISALEAFKATECNNWAHLVCALWTPGVSFVDSKKMSLVEGIGNLPQETHEAVSIRSRKGTERTRFYRRVSDFASRSLSLYSLFLCSTVTSVTRRMDLASPVAKLLATELSTSLVLGLSNQLTSLDSKSSQSTRPRRLPTPKRSSLSKVKLESCLLWLGARSTRKLASLGSCSIWENRIQRVVW